MPRGDRQRPRLKITCCYVPETHDLQRGLSLSALDIVERLLDPVGEPRDGVTVSGGEPFAQAKELVTLLKSLKDLGIHTVVYSGYTLNALARRSEPEISALLKLTDVLIEGPFIAALADGAGEWRGSRNQRIIPNPGDDLLSRESQTLTY